MSKPNMPNMPNIPGMEAMNDTLDFMKNFWGGGAMSGMNMGGMSMPGMPGMNIPGMVMPTLSVEELQKKIKDLKAVEAWLNLNMGMLRSTIQALEVQSTTLSALQSMGEAFASSMGAGKTEDAGNAGSGGSSFSGFDTRSAGGSAGNGSDGAHMSEKMEGAPEPTSKDQSDAAALTAPLMNAAAWWNMLQDQFKHAVNTAMVETPAASEKPAAQKRPASEPGAKPRSGNRAASSAAPANPKSGRKSVRSTKTSK